MNKHLLPFRKYLFQTRIILGFILFSGTSSLFSSEPVTVELQNGHVLKGEIDAETDDANLWIRRSETGIVLSSSYAWSEVARIRHGDRWLSVTDFRPLVEKLKSKAPENFFLNYLKSTPPPHPDGTSRTRGGNPPEPCRISSVQTEAYVASWDANVATDGIELHLFPLDAEHRVIPVDGSLDIRLFGRALNRAGHTKRFPQLDRWTKKINAGDFRDGVAILRLPFRNVQPDFNFNLGRDALVHVRLSVPGQGVFEASEDLLQLRRPSWYRDQLQQETGSRYLPVERAFRRPLATDTPDY